ncbi:hypothetical protein [Pseudogracilibacillus auburnensis]|uniref:hypothetical protein n=1 Tax=Pseudogracilibacillus auburnensis TaxID=1494959 RepID=UPI001A97A26E|nr:hypothetical protein [Pseudogracilibacillus auburnensis]MBO1001885.1 hypothetical protein [Pseudogracilibacillus auburnensis]
MRKKHALLIIVFFIIYLLTFLPNFGVMNELRFIGFLPQSLAWVLFLNAINTVIIFIVYFKFFKPFAQNVETLLKNEKESEQI